MDWSSIYEESGEERGQWNHVYETRLSRLTHVWAKDHKSAYTPIICYFFTINYILGVGVLGMPYAFHASGIFLASVLVILVTFLSYVTVIWNSEAMLRAEVLGLLSNDERTTPKASDQSGLMHHSGHPLARSKEVLSPMHYSDSSGRSGRARALSNLEVLGPDELAVAVGNGGGGSEEEEGAGPCLEITELSRMFLGGPGRTAYQAALVGLMYVGLLAYAQVFSQTLAAQLMHGVPKFLLAVIFSVIVVPLSCAELREQINVQVAMSLLRFAAIFIIVFGAMYGIYKDPIDNGSTTIAPPYIAEVKYVDPSGFGLMFSTVLFSQLFQHSVPGLIHPLARTHKVKAPQVFGAALMTTASIYLVLGTTCSMYFGSMTETAINTNFSEFSWGLLPSANIDEFHRLSLTLCTQLVVLFPGLDTLSVFPLIANTLGSNLHSASPSFKKVMRQRFGLKISTRQTILFWKLASSVPPIILSLVLTDLSMTFKFAGIFGIYVAFITPALLFWKSTEACKQNQVTPKTIYSLAFFSNLCFVVLVLVVSSVFLVIVVYQIVQAYCS
mmetsp:Transcript_4879/g.8675  ORF Transcript_4879/g.8675 Transcript_4879/m.8675 type:complete len:556 (-) Transcript_4879:276-1943(-)